MRADVIWGTRNMWNASLKCGVPLLLVFCRYGKMGYGFGRGSYNITPQQYAAAVARVQNAPLSAIAADFAAVKQLGSSVHGTLLAILQHYTARGKVHTMQVLC